jgi:hypothetical protein
VGGATLGTTKAGELTQCLIEGVLCVNVSMRVGALQTAARSFKVVATAETLLFSKEIDFGGAISLAGYLQIHHLLAGERRFGKYADEIVRHTLVVIQEIRITQIAEN